MNKKKYKIFFNRTYYSYIEVEYPDDGADHKEIINELIEDGDTEIWTEMAEAEAQAAQNQQQDKIDLPDETAEKKD